MQRPIRRLISDCCVADNGDWQMSQYDQVLRRINMELTFHRKKKADLVRDIDAQFNSLGYAERNAITGDSVGGGKEYHARRAVDLRNVVNNLYLELEDCEQIISQLEDMERQIKSAGANGLPQQGKGTAVRVPNTPVSLGSARTPQVASVQDFVDAVNKLERLLTKR